MFYRKILLFCLPVLLLASCTATKSYYIGEPAKTNDIQYTVNNFYNTKSIDYVFTTEYNYTIINITISNMSKESKDIFPGMLMLYVNNNSCGMNLASLRVENGFGYMVTIGAGMEKAYNLSYETATEATENDYLLVKSDSKGSKAAKIYLRQKADI